MAYDERDAFVEKYDKLPPEARDRYMNYNDRLDYTKYCVARYAQDAQRIQKEKMA